MTTMNSFFRKRTIRYPLAGLSLLGMMAAVFLLMSQFWLGLIFSVLFLATIGVSWKMEDQTYIETEKHIKSLSYRMKKVGEEALLQLPIGIILINENSMVEWANPYASKVFKLDSLIGKEIFDLSEQLDSIVRSDDTEKVIMTFEDESYNVSYNLEEKLIYLFDVTEKLAIEDTLLCRSDCSRHYTR